MLVVKQRIGLLVLNSRGRLLNFRINVTIGNEDIQPAVVVVVEKASPKAEYLMGRSGDAGLITDLVEEALAIVLPKVIGGSLKIGNVQIELTVVFKISQRDTHGRHSLSLSGKGHAAG